MNQTRMRGILLALVAAVGLLGGTAVAAMMAPPSVSIVAPAMGTTIHTTNIPVKLAVVNFHIECANVGRTSAPMDEGHIHAMVDGLSMAHLTNVACDTAFTISGQGLKPGRHTLAVLLANDSHAMNSLPAMTSFNYQPRTARPLPNPIAGTPSLRIISPKSGAAVPRRFNLVLAVRNFGLSCDLEGKPNVHGWGHLHVMVQQQGETTAASSTPMVAMMNTPQGMTMSRRFMQQTHMTAAQLQPMLAMAEPSLVGMPCTETVPVDLSTWRSGAARIVVQLANDDHMPTMGAKPAMISVNVK